MNEQQFRYLMDRARHTTSDEYYQGYQRGLRRRYHGDSFGTAEEHERWMRLAPETRIDDPRYLIGVGYIDGYAGKPPSDPRRPIVPDAEGSDDEPDSGPYCEHWQDPSTCADGPCACGHLCGEHTYVRSGEHRPCSARGCDCAAFRDAGGNE